MLDKYGFIFLSPDADPARDRTVMATGGMTAFIVAVPDPSKAPAVAAAMAPEGVKLIELCGAFGPVWTNEVLEATSFAVPVGAVSYGVESVKGLATLIAGLP